MGMGAVDVAFTEAAVGAGVSTVLFIAILFNTTRRIKFNPMDISTKIFAGIIRAIVGWLLHLVYLICPVGVILIRRLIGWCHHIMLKMRIKILKYQI